MRNRSTSFALARAQRRRRVIGWVVAAVCLMLGHAAWSHENKLSCTSDAAKQPAIEAARAELQRKAGSANVRLDLADKLIGVGCYDEAVHVLEDGLKLAPNDRTLEAKLKTARSFIGEREYLDKQPAKTANSAEFLRFQLRCKQFGEQTACDQALAVNPNDAALWAAKGDALLKDKRAQEALAAFNRAKQVGATSGQAADIDIPSRINAAQALLVAQRPPSIVTNTTPVAATQTAARTTSARIYTNLEPAGRSN